MNDCKSLELVLSYYTTQALLFSYNSLHRVRVLLLVANIVAAFVLITDADSRL